MSRRGLIGAFLVISLIGGQAWAKGRIIAVVEYRAGVREAPGIAAIMAEELSRLTSHRVVGPAEVRLRAGAEVDGQVARCKGDPACIARIGERLECEEVILVGVSQLGDLILAIQRIDVASGKVLARLADSVSPKRRIRGTDLQGYLRRLLPPSDFKRYGQVVVRTGAGGDEVFLDEVSRGKTPLAALVVPAPGRYALRVTRAGHEDFAARLDVLPEATVEVTAKLVRRAQTPRWYQQWWVWALVGGVVTAGATAAAVTATRGQSSVPAVIHLGN
jgi:hypothetical protein